MKPIEQLPFVRAWFDQRRVLVVGLGKSGVAAASLLARLGARVAVTEKKDRSNCLSWVRQLPASVQLETGAHRLLQRDWDLAVVSPGVPAEVGNSFREKGVPVWGELELAYRVLVLADRWPAWSAAITGTNGKTTTTSLMGAIFRAAGRNTVVAGNIGVPLCAVINDVRSDGAVALEVSSYQLETAEAFRPAGGVVLNVTPDHLARHGTMAAYARTKFRLFQSQQPADAAILNSQDPWCRTLAPTVHGRVHWFNDRISRPWKTPRYLPGRHNVANAMAAAVCARALGVPDTAIARALAAFRGVEHRLEPVRTWRGVRFINDSKATNVDSTRVALDSLPGPLFIILGGEDKGAPYGPLIPLLKKKAKEILLIGEATPKIAKELAGAAPQVVCGTLAKAVQHAASSAQPGDTLLLSPACASFDQFDNFEHRGRCFKKEVGLLP
ncbi:MAG: UDP-N-acetylmuramoyl-L-alanine--D-glutamate ligase [Elusimicrobia bacterium]|nr:UDP-N-acetylmuramoyl-L-alanine--D-glutamate ligase [Elusimicrobiota bacterium]MBP9127176.1 UDP-N-acetylmuramoyl-L-alanine--D-glutamate ligase [Elusimicrobiota bacterium]